MRTWTERMLLKGGYNSRADALIVGQNIKVLLKLLESDGGIKGCFGRMIFMINIIIFPCAKRGNLADYPADREAEKRKAKAVFAFKISHKERKKNMLSMLCAMKLGTLYI